MIKYINHISITVKDLKEMIAFFRDVLEQENIWPTYEYEGDIIDSITGLSNVHMKVGKVQIDSLILEFIQYLSPPGRDLKRNTNDVGYPHIGFVVDNMEIIYEKLKNKGVKFKSVPQLIADMSNPMCGSRAVYFWGPEGTTFELIQLPDK